MLWFQALVALLLVAVYVVVRPGWRRTGPFLPDAYLLGLSFYALGATWLLAFEPAIDLHQIAGLAWTALSSGTVGAILYCLMVQSSRDTSFIHHVGNCKAGPLEFAAIVCGLLIASIVCLLFIYLVFTTDVIAGLLGIGAAATDFDLRQARLAMTSGSEVWLAPGYVKQFRDILLPVLLAAWIIHDRRSRRSLLFWLCAVLALAAILVSGQRLVVVVFLLTLALASYYARRAEAQANGQVTGVRFPWIPVAFVAAIYGLLTYLLGRITEGATGFAAGLDVAANLLDRIFLAAPRENAITFAVWSESAPTLGASWLDDLSGIAPGVAENLSNILHIVTGGSPAGNSPLGLAADVWLAWGRPGLLLIPALFGLAVGLLDLACRMRQSPIFVALLCYLFLVIPICYSPFLFLLYGGGAAAALFCLVVLFRPGRRLAGLTPIRKLSR